MVVRLSQIAFFALVSVLAVSCARSGESTGPTSTTIVGRISGLVSASQVRIFYLNDDGSKSDDTCAASSDGAGHFQCDADLGDYDSFGPILVSATDAGGNELRAILNDYPSDGSITISVGWLSDISTERAFSLVGQQVALASAIAAADAELRSAAGFSGMGSLAVYDPSDARERATREAFETSLRAAGPTVHDLGRDFAANRAFTGPNTAIWSGIPAVIGAMSAQDAYAPAVIAAPAAVPIDFSITGPVIAITPPFSVTWSSALSDSYQVTICKSPSSSAPDCSSTVASGTSTDFAPGDLDGGTYYVWVQTADGRDASNSSQSLPYSFRVVSQ